MLQAIRALAATGGILAEPAGAAAFAGLEPAMEAGLIDRDDTIVVHVTGTGLKSPQYLQPKVPPIEIIATLEGVEQAIETP